MQDGTFEQKLDEILIYLHAAYIKSIGEGGNIGDAPLYKEDILTHLIRVFSDKGIQFDSFIERLERDNKITFIEQNGVRKCKISSQGRDFITSGDSYVNIAKREKRKKELEINQLESQIETNRISNITNKYIAIFTFIAALYYCFELFKDCIPECYEYKSIVIYIILSVLFFLGIIGYLSINRIWPLNGKVT